MKLQAVLLSTLFLSTPAFAASEPEFHDLCLEAKDYAGCVRAMTTDVTAPQVQIIDQTNRLGVRQEMGNACPSGMAYAGNGSCRNIVCYRGGIFGSNAEGLGGKGHKCPRYGFTRLTMAWGNSYMPAVNNPNCPQREPSIGSLSSCHDGGPGSTLQQQLDSVKPYDIRDSQ